MWSIGIYTGSSPFELSPAPGIGNPVLMAADVTDVPAQFVADPFLVRAGDGWHMFFEVLKEGSRNGEIGWATSLDGLRWRYRRIVLAEPFHLSYPYVFEWEGACFMVPETLTPGAVRLYRADPFPERWVYVQDLVPVMAADSSLFRFDGRWWMFLCPTPHEHDSLALYHADRLEGPWREHPRSPLLTGEPRASRPAGRVLVRDGRVFRFAQDCRPRYGTRVRAFEVTRLTPEEYAEVEAGTVLEPTGSGWNGMRMHHVDPHPLPGGGWIACVDGFSLSEGPKKRPRLCLVFPHLGLGGGETVMMDVAEGLRGEFDLDVCALQDGRLERTLVPELDARFGGWTLIRKRWELRPRFQAADAVLWYGVVNGVPSVLAGMEERPASIRVVHTDREVDGPGFERRWGRVVDATVCVSPKVARKIPGAVFIPNTCSGETLKGDRLELFPPGRPTLGFLGRLVPLKNVPWLIDNVEALGCNLLIQAMDTQLITVAEMQRRAAKAGFKEDRIRFLPPSRDVGTLLRSVDALILVSDHEGFPRVVVEAGMVGTPVISTRVGALPELFGEEILFVDHPPYTKSVETALKLLDPSWGERLRDKVSRLCAPERVVARYAEVIREAVAARSTS